MARRTHRLTSRSSKRRSQISVDIKAVREELELSQSDFAALLAVSPRTIQSCEQEWRAPSAALEKAALLLLLAHRNGPDFGKHTCWKVTGCERQLRVNCIAYRSRQGHLFWFLTGTFCKNVQVRTWDEKLALCSECEFFGEVTGGSIPTREKK